MTFQRRLRRRMHGNRNSESLNVFIRFVARLNFADVLRREMWSAWRGQRYDAGPTLGGAWFRHMALCSFMGCAAEDRTCSSVCCTSLAWRSLFDEGCVNLEGSEVSRNCVMARLGRRGFESFDTKPCDAISGTAQSTRAREMHSEA
jgi:hypothetical protein